MLRVGDRNLLKEFSPHPQSIEFPATSPLRERCSTCFTYGLVQRMRKGDPAGGGHGGNTSYQEDVVSKGICSIVRMCARALQFRLTVGYWFETRPGPGVLLVAIITLGRSLWLSTGMACFTLGAALLNFHRPLRQCRALSGLAVS